MNHSIRSGRARLLYARKALVRFNSNLLHVLERLGRIGQTCLVLWVVIDDDMGVVYLYREVLLMEALCAFVPIGPVFEDFLARIMLIGGVHY